MLMKELIPLYLPVPTLPRTLLHNVARLDNSYVVRRAVRCRGTVGCKRERSSHIDLGILVLPPWICRISLAFRPETPETQLVGPTDPELQPIKIPRFDLNEWPVSELEEASGATWRSGRLGRSDQQDGRAVRDPRRRQEGEERRNPARVLGTKSNLSSRVSSSSLHPSPGEYTGETGLLRPLSAERTAPRRRQTCL